MKKERFARRLTAFLTAAMIALMPASVQAYDHDSYKRSEDGMWYVDHFHGESVSVVLYELAEADTDRLYSKGVYMFTCTDGEFPADYQDENPPREGFMGYEYIGADADEVGEVDGNPIWRWSFGLQPGTYAFADGNEWGGISTFTRDFRILSYFDGREEITLEEGDTIVLYALAGSEEWKKSVADRFVLWAQEIEKDLTMTGSKDFIEIEITQSVERPVVTEKPSRIPVEIEPASTEEPKAERNRTGLVILGGVSLAALIGTAVYFKKKY